MLTDDDDDDDYYYYVLFSSSYCSELQGATSFLGSGLGEGGSRYYLVGEERFL